MTRSLELPALPATFHVAILAFCKCHQAHPLQSAPSHHAAAQYPRLAKAIHILRKPLVINILLDNRTQQSAAFLPNHQYGLPHANQNRQ
jgi:hypothetical protein